MAPARSIAESMSAARGTSSTMRSAARSWARTSTMMFSVTSAM